MHLYCAQETRNYSATSLIRRYFQELDRGHEKYIRTAIVLGCAVRSCASSNVQTARIPDLWFSSCVPTVPTSMPIQGSVRAEGCPGMRRGWPGAHSARRTGFRRRAHFLILRIGPPRWSLLPGRLLHGLRLYWRSSLPDITCAAWCWAKTLFGQATGSGGTRQLRHPGTAPDRRST